MSRPISSEPGKRPAAKFHPDDRRSSLAANTERTNSTMASNPKDNKRPLVTVMSEDLLGSSSLSQVNPTTTINTSSNQKQSFLSKFARSEVRTSKSVERAAATTTMTDTNQRQNPQVNTSDACELRKLDGDKLANLTSKQNIDANNNNNNNNNMLPTRSSKSFCENYTSDSATTKKKDTTCSGDNDDDDDDDDNDQVLPSWPTKLEASALKPLVVQHQVYSLKDYSQVAGPTSNVATSNVAPQSSSSSSLVSGRLLKSMSQDRKVDSRTKRMSECLTSSAGYAGFYPSGSNAANQVSGEGRQSAVGLINPRPRNTSVAAASSMSMGPAASVNSLLPPNSGKNSAPLGASRIDRMRKLFVSPLSLRGSTTSSSKSSHPSSSSPRLSLQAGANMLNKPHHLMHAMYRGRGAGQSAGLGSHHARRSPMRQKQGKGSKGFRVYGCPLNMANTMYPITCFGRPDIYKQQSVPYILTRLCNYIEENSSQLTHEGIFRVSGNARLMEKLKTLFDHLGDAPLESESVDVATSASMLKMYLRELPEPLIPSRMNYYFFTLAKKYASVLTKPSSTSSNMTAPIASSSKAAPTTTTKAASSNSGIANEATSISDPQSSFERQRVAFLRDLTKLIRKLPFENYNLLKYLTCFLHRVALKQQSNKMSAEALGIVFGPNVFRIRSESYKGLKEQELSNQVMASIITNYKLLFDCELTDPLGNLIKSSENLHLGGSGSAREQDIAAAIRPSTLLDKAVAVAAAAAAASVDSGESAFVSRDSKSRNLATSSPSIASTSTNFDGQFVRNTLCPKHGRHIRHHYDATRARIHHDDGDDDDDEEDDDDEDLECDDDDDDDVDSEDDDLDSDAECDDESFSPSSGSGSYCSSLASDSDDSNYDGDFEADQYFHGDADLNTNSSSQCISETSYTPSSSHSDSDEDAARGSSSNFSSTPSLSRGMQEISTNADGTPRGSSEKPCQVCKRRESAQIEQASKLREQLAATAAAAASASTSLVARSDGQIIESIEGDEAKLERSSRVRQHHRASSTRKRGRCSGAAADNSSRPSGAASSSSAAHVVITKENYDHDNDSTNALASTSAKATTMTRDGFNQKDSLSSPIASGGGKQQSSGGRLKAPHFQKPNLLRRKSSSTSSLNRMILATRDSRSSRKRNAASRRGGGGDNDDTHHQPRSRLHSERRRYGGESRGYNSRKSRHKSHLPSHTSGSAARSEHRKSGETASSSAGGGGKSPTDWKKGDYYIPELIAMNLPPEVRKDLVWNYVASSILEAPAEQCDERYACTGVGGAAAAAAAAAGFQLRSHMSDETLLKTQEADAAENIETSTRSRRRFSGQEYLTSNHERILVGRPQFGEIYESFEGAGGGGGDDMNSGLNLELGNAVGDLSDMHCRALGRSANTMVETSVVSLLEDQMISFKHSELSLNNDVEMADPIMLQLKVTRSFIRSLRKLLKYGCVNGFDQETFNYLIKSIGDLGSDNRSTRDYTTCYVDHITGKSTVMTLDCLQPKSPPPGGSLSRVDQATQERLESLLRHTIGNLKRRYNNLKYIRDHYRKHHSERVRRRREEANESSPVVESQSTSQQQNNDHSNNEMSSDQEISIGSALNTPTCISASTSNTGGNDRFKDLGGGGGGGCKQSNRDEEPSRRNFAWSCRFGSLCPVEFVYNIENHLASRRVTGERQVKLDDMSYAQLQSEKLELQKNLLRYEHWFNRPTTRSEFNLVGHLYERYRAIKIIKQRKQESAD